MASKNQTINIKTANGSVRIVRTPNTATITEERTCYGFKEKAITTVTKLSSECMHFAFGSEETIKEMYKTK